VTPEMIRDRMADTREALAADLERLRERANPKAILRHQLSATKGRLFRAEHKALAPFHRSAAGADQADNTGPDGPADPADDGEAGHRGGRLRSVGSAVRRTVTARPALAAGVAAGIGVALAVILPGPRRGR
jgi:hypothetical protein